LIFEDIWVLDTGNKEWYSPETTGEKPAKRIGFSCKMIFGDVMLIFAGADELSANCQLYNDSYILNLTTMEWSKLDCKGSLPEPRIGHTASVSDTHMFVFGGYTIAEDCKEPMYFNDIYILDLHNAEWTKP
jgi:N-acetylneuraminic acid mutarotase